jgi:hypothetical protein
LNAIEDYENLKKEEEVVSEQRMMKPSDLKGLRKQVFVNPRQHKLRNNIEQLMIELKKIKALDP